MNYKRFSNTTLVFGLVLLFIMACGKSDPETPTPPVDNSLATFDPDEEYAGGKNATTFDFSENAFGEQVNGLELSQQTDFVVGNSIFRSNWVTAPASVQSLDGLGPMMNAISCGACHFKDGRAKPPATPDAPLNGLLFRLSVPGKGAHGDALGDPIYGGQLQDKAVLGAIPEAKVRVNYEEISGKYADGSTYSLRKPKYEIYDWAFGAPAAGLLVSPRIAPQMPGLGLLEAIAESDILKNADENDVNKDGISGRPNRVWDAEAKQTVLGRFGWKSNQPNLKSQTAGAFLGDIGITSSVNSSEDLTNVQQVKYATMPNGGTPEIEDTPLNRVVFYAQALAVPARRKANDTQVLRGKKLFETLNCSGCHTPQFKTDNSHKISVLRNQKIFPFSDLLLHDMGNDLADNRPDFEATGNEWRTPPLWGIGLLQTVNGHTFMMHDGRARNVEEAILWHGGESEQSKEKFKQLSKTDREALLKFVDSL